jgi:predicted PurR-regulated permease PerM
VTTSPLPISEAPLPPVVQAVASRPSNEEIAAWVLIAAGIFFVMFQHIVSALIAGLAFYVILEGLSEWFSRHVHRTTARPLALVLVTMITGGIVVGGIALSVSYLRQHANNIPAMVTKMADILQSTRTWLGDVGEQIIPDVLTDADNFKAEIAAWLKTHAATLQVAGGSFSHALVHMIMGMLLAVLVFFRHVTHHDDPKRGPLARALVQKVDRFTHAFQRIGVAQIKISMVNTLITTLYLVSLPMFGKPMPFLKTLILLTFVCGLIPVLGNLISNAVIVILSLGISVGTAVASLIFLVIVHKLQYILNSRIVGGEVDAQAWEILFAIIVGEAAFGIGGVVMAPIVYAFVKWELREKGLV